ncbi:adenylate cyclase [Phyllobacterium sp. LjRoot231]|uniref:ATP-binding protein n=1 Tax=Phyllobacterium sp. LjRoot231 TaxID=3342289 RepID=UPI003ECF0825
MALLATSREPLGVPGESIFRVPRLAVPAADDISTVTALDYPAIQLFVERATAVTEDFELTEANLEAVVSICRQVDGIPLAIELAVPRLRMMRPEWIAARLRDRFRLLGSGSRTVAPRHRTLQTLFDWSYNLLDEREQTLLRRLAVFAGGWNVDSAAAVVSGDPVDSDDILDLITALADKSLVVADLTAEETRYRLLETTRQYSLEKLRETGERGRRRLLAEYLIKFFAEATSSWPTLSTAEWMSSYEPEIENLRAALEWAFGPNGDITLGMELTSYSLRIWDELALLPERERWFQAAILAVDDDTPTALRARLWLGCTSISEHGDRSAFDAALKATELFRILDDQLGLSEALTKAGASVLTPERREEAAPYLDEALAILRLLGHTKQLASCLRSAAVSAYFAGDFETARSMIKECVSVTKIVGDEHGLVNAMIALAELEFAAGDIGSAISIVRRTIDEGHCNRRQLTLCVGNLTSYLLSADRLVEAKLTAFNGLHKARALGWPAAIVRIIENMALIAGLGGDLERAARLLGYTEGFYALETASREITEKASYERLLSILANGLAPEMLAKYRLEGARSREAQIVQMAMEV